MPALCPEAIQPIFVARSCHPVLFAALTDEDVIENKETLRHVFALFTSLVAPVPILFDDIEP